MPIREKIKIAFINVQKIYKEGLQVILKKHTKIEIVGEAKTDSQFLRFICQKKPNILLVDVCEPGTECVAGIFNVIQYYPNTKVIILITSGRDEVLFDLLQAGVQGFVKKEDDSEILEAIIAVFKGEPYYSKKLLSNVDALLQEAKKNTARATKQLLTKREEKIIAYICEEMTNKEIGGRLHLSVRTVEGCRVKILQKIQAKSTAGIVLFAIENNLFKLHNRTKAVIHNSQLQQ